MLRLPEFSLQTLLAPAHLLAYSTLLGTQLYHSFVIVKVTFKALPYDAFTSLQKQLFPTYFRCQSSLLLLTVATLPPHGPASLPTAEWKVLVPFFIAGMMAALNLVHYGPKSSRLMMMRRFQGKLIPPPCYAHSAVKARVLIELSGEMEARKGIEGSKTEVMGILNRSFKQCHAMSIHLNIIAVVATLWYGWHLASRLHFE